MTRRFQTEHFDQETVRAAVTGCCHDFAIALHRRTGWSVGALWEMPLGDGFDISTEPQAVHVFCVAPDGTTVDAEGIRPQDDLVAIYAPGRRKPVRAVIHGTEAEWVTVCTENFSAASLAPREHGIAAAAAVIEGSESFTRLLEDLALDGRYPHP